MAAFFKSNRRLVVFKIVSGRIAPDALLKSTLRLFPACSCFSFSMCCPFYLLLGLNCAMTQQDIADLKQTEVDWSDGIITRKRSKTSDCENVPEVSYRLWSTTFDLLKQERSQDLDRVLLTRDGNPLKNEQINAKDKLSKSDAVRLSLRRLSQKSGIPFTMKMLKKSAASLLRNNRQYRGLESLFLDHAPTSMADKHYTGVPQDLLDEAIAWLGRELCIE